MAKWSASAQMFTPVAVADNTNFTDSGYLALQGGSATQVSKITEVKMGGLAASTSSPTPMILGRDSTVGVTLSGGFSGALDPATAALAAPPVGFTIATTKPKRSTTLQPLMCGFNAYGGIYQFVAPKDFEIGMLGNAASFGEISLSCMTGGTPGAIDATIFFEPL